ncbi:MAG TPA: hypothetical protein VF771_02330 [Longimicrobiaceae bacterium]
MRAPASFVNVTEPQSSPASPADPVNTLAAAPRRAPAAAAPPRASRTAPALWLVATQALALASLAAWGLITGFSLVSRGPQSAGALMPRPLLYLFWIYPVLPLACSVAAWRAFRRGDARRAVAWSAVVLAGSLPLLAYAWYMASPVG